MGNNLWAAKSSEKEKERRTEKADSGLFTNVKKIESNDMESPAGT